MNYLVLVKQVPDIKNIPKDAWDIEKGTLKRALLDNVCNELDKQALTFALSLRKQLGGEVVSLTMGPPFAEEVLTYTLSVGADKGVLLTDRKLGGADTPATSYPLAQAIRRIAKDMFQGDNQYLIITGMQSIDGDTAQVPPQVAEELNMPHIAYATGFSIENGDLRVERITRRGAETMTPQSFPCMITVTEWTKLFYPSFSRTRWAYSQELYRWNVEDIDADSSLIGLGGSRTDVVRVFSPKEVSKKSCIFEENLEKLVKMVKEAYHAEPASSEETTQPKYQLPSSKQGNYQGEVWVYAEQEGGEINPASFEILGKATELAGSLHEKTAAILVGENVKHLASELIARGADKVYVVEHKLVDHFLPIPYKKAISELIANYKPQIMLFSATPLGRELAPRVAYSSKSGLTADCTELDIIDHERGTQELTAVMMQTRPALGGNIMASIITKNSPLQMATVRPGVMKALEPDKSKSGELIEFAPHLTKSDFGVRIISSELYESTVALKDADIIVSGGVGLKSKESFERYIPPLAENFGGFLNQQAMVGASRLAVEAGFIDHSHQVGQTGQTVTPNLYVAVGISGAVQHITGMQNSKVILAINKESNARIFKAADFGIVGNLETIIPDLIQALKGV
jgi:electron transfer flavoprotein alpha subunit